MTTEDFYLHLKPFNNFLDLANPVHYVQVPDDWYLLITDIVDSTQAIEAGQYKEVNLLGASSIISVLNVIGAVQIPFIFGGDGASLVVPPSVLGASRQALSALRRLAQEAFKMELRVGIVPVKDLKNKYPLMIAKLRVTPQYSQANFMGGGLTYATDLIKGNKIYQIEQVGNIPKADLSGLECRWQDILSPCGDTLSLIVSPLNPVGKLEKNIYQEIIKKIDSLYGKTPGYHPISLSAMKLSFNPRKLRGEMKARAKANNIWQETLYLGKMMIENIIGLILMKFKLQVGNINWGQYGKDIPTASDYQKIDDVLRMVIVSKPSQTQELEQYLEQQFQDGNLVYGIHVSNRALMTCLIFEGRDNHVHLIDSADGGYALAAKGFKQRQRKNKGSLPSF